MNDTSIDIEQAEDVPGYAWDVPEDLDCEDIFTWEAPETEDVIRDFITSLPEEPVERRLPRGLTTSEQGAAEVYGYEVGDDRVDFSNSPLLLAVATTVQETVYGMKTSDEDTFISPRFFNFTEVTSMIPASPQQSFDFCRKAGSFDKLGFTDAPPLRTILNVSKGDGSHSSSSVGKAAMMGARMRTTRKDGLATLQLASFLQDGMLRTWQSEDPKYLPMVIGGSSVPPPYGVAWNTFSYMKSYKGGGRDRLYGTAINTARTALRDMESGRPPDTRLLAFLRSRGDYHRITYADKVLLPVDEFYQIQGEVSARPVLTDLSGPVPPAAAAVVQRLVRSREVIPQRQAQIEADKAARIDMMFSSHGRIPFEWYEERLRISRKEGRERFGGAGTASAAAQNLLNREGGLHDLEELLGTGAFRAATGGARGISKEQCAWLQDARTDNFDLHDLMRAQDRIYIRSEVSAEDSMKVPGITLRPLGADNESVTEVVTRTEIGRYQISASQLEYAQEITEMLTAFREDNGRPAVPEDLIGLLIENPTSSEWIADDHVLAARAARDAKEIFNIRSRIVVLLVSDDRKLAARLQKILGVPVGQISSLDYSLAHARQSPDLNIGPEGDPEVEAVQILSAAGVKLDDVHAVYLDWGSIHAAAQTLEVDYEHSAKSAVTRTFLRNAFSNPDGSRTEVRSVRMYSELRTPKVHWYSTFKARQEVGSWRLRSGEPSGSALRNTKAMA